MTHIDPFAPGDSPQHPANWNDAAPVDNWQMERQRFVMSSEVAEEVTVDVLEVRGLRYVQLLEQYGTPVPGERDGTYEEASQPELLRREVYGDLDDEEIDEWKALFEQHSTEDERDPLWVEDVLPDLAELRARDDAAKDAQAVVDALPVPKSNALKEDWVEYAVKVSALRGEPITREEADTMNAADLKAKFKPQAV